MGHSIREMARLTARSKQIDGMGFGGVAADNLEVAGALGMANPRTGKKLSNGAYWLARVLYCDDQGDIRSQLNSWVLWNIDGDGKVLESSLLVDVAIEELRKPKTILDKSSGERCVRPYSFAQIARMTGTKKLTDTQRKKYEEIITLLLQLNADAIAHLRDCLN